MATNIKVPDSAWHSQDVTLGGVLLNLTFKYNTADESWYIDIADSSENLILSGVKVMPNQSLTGRYSYKQSLPSGNLWCIRRKNDFSPVSRNNFGIGRTYELWWIGEDEEKELNIDGTIQL